MSDRFEEFQHHLLAASTARRVLLAEGSDPRVAEAVRALRALGVEASALVAPGERRLPATWCFDLDPDTDPLRRAAELLVSGAVDSCVAGVASASGDVLRVGLQMIGKRSPSALVSSIFLMVCGERLLGLGDCVVNPTPTSEQLAVIAMDCAITFETLTGIEPRVAMLSFSTYGSSSHEEVSRVQRATDLLRTRRPELVVDGELQVDAALVPEVSALKAPGSSLRGDANVLIFPTLAAGNIGYKLVERLGHARAIGPVIQGLAKPFLDISRGSTASDLVTQCLVAGALATQQHAKVNL